MRVAVIGGGASGLVTLKYLKTAHEFFPDQTPISAKLFESAPAIGGAYTSKENGSAKLSSSRQSITFSDYRYTSDFFDFLSADDYCHYLEGYVQHFGLTDLIHLSTTVTKIDRTIRGGHIIHYTKDGHASKWACDAVAICSGGRFPQPSTPDIPDPINQHLTRLLPKSIRAEIFSGVPFDIGYSYLFRVSFPQPWMRLFFDRYFCRMASLSGTPTYNIEHKNDCLDLPFLDPSYPLPQHAKVRSIWKKDEPNVGFIGFVCPSVVGAIPPISELQAQLWVTNLLNRLPSALDLEIDHYRVSTASTCMVVNHDAYMYQLAVDLDSVPDTHELFELGGWKIMICWLLSGSINTRYRLTGSWKWNEAQKVMGTEIWETIARRSLFVHFVFSFIPIILFYSMTAMIFFCSVFLEKANAWCEEGQNDQENGQMA